MTEKWQVRLKGDPSGLKFLETTLSGAPRTVIRDQKDGGYYYESDSFHQCSTVDQLSRIAESEVAVLSGIARLEGETLDPLIPDGTYRKKTGTGYDVQLFHHETAYARDKLGIVVIRDTNADTQITELPAPSTPRSARLVQLSITDQAVAKVLRLLSSPDSTSWVGLYRIYEVIEDAIGGQHQVISCGWTSSRELKRFKHSANSVKVGGDDSRHGSESDMPPSNPMALPEAEALVMSLFQAWIASKNA